MQMRYLFVLIVLLLLLNSCSARKRRKRGEKNAGKRNSEKKVDVSNPADYIWAKHTVAAGDTAVLHCSFDAMYPTYYAYKSIDWTKEPHEKSGKGKLLATGDKMVYDNNNRYRVFTPSGTALSVLIIRRAKKSDSGLFRCNLSDSGHRHKYLLLNVTDSSIEAQTSPDEVKGYVGENVTLWCNATGYPRPMIYWTRENSHDKLPDGTYQHWGNSLQVSNTKKTDGGSYLCYVDNFVQPIMSYVFKLKILNKETKAKFEAEMFRYDSPKLYVGENMKHAPPPVRGRAYILVYKMYMEDYNPNMKIHMTWFKENKKLKRYSKRFMILDYTKSSKPYRAESTLIIRTFDNIDNGNYICHFQTENLSNWQVFKMHKKPIDPNPPFGPTPSPTPKVELVKTKMPKTEKLYSMDDEDFADESSGHN
ncbi:DgyrCDS2471 [Dimorphilus gyrociliatus]|uniref:DgyrCDS2471 n=1 Tax=Dimorphilus gyrociliatus TaxID=2664684 RepID=A0A7I8VAL5_9ANNE|nr:DgyrCDS2471 [Dimorphilus gyrociliatus]